MKKTVLISIIFIFIFSSINAQKKMMAKLKEQSLDVQKKTLAVVLKDEKKELNKTYNEYIKKAIESEWTFNENIEFIDAKKFKKLRKEKNKEYAYLANFTKQDFSNDVDQFYNVITIRSFDSKKAVISNPFEFNKKTTLVEVYVQIQSAQNWLHTFSIYTYKKMKMKDIKQAYKDQSKYAEPIKNMTLYINKDGIKNDLKSKIATIYKYEYKLVDQEEIRKAILENDKSVAYISGGTVVTADEGKMLLSFIQLKGRVSISSPINFSSNKLNLKDFKNLVKYLN